MGLYSSKGQLIMNPSFVLPEIRTSEYTKHRPVVKIVLFLHRSGNSGNATVGMFFKTNKTTLY